MKVIDKEYLNSLSNQDRARLINSLLGVKSANLIGTQSKSGSTNLSMVSSLFHLGASPALFGFVIRPDTVTRDTLNNLREHPYLTVNHVCDEITEKAHQASARYPADISEFNECLLNVDYLDKHIAPFVKESKIKFAAKFIREISIPENGTHILICEVLAIFMADDYLDEDQFIDITKASSIGVSGLDQYLKLEAIGRLSYAKPNKNLKWLKPF